LFQKNGPTVLPEIFFLDVPTLQSIRNTTRTAASGCALGWHASQAAKCNPEVLLQEESKGSPLVKAMQNRQHNSIQDYEQSVEDAVVSLAQSWKGSPLDEEVETLRGQTCAVLRGKDAVMQLLDDRTRKLFVELAVDDDDSNAPLPALRSGRQPTDSKKEDSPYSSKARLRFRERGLGFYASELAHASELATKVANLAYALYAEEFLDQMILEALDIDEVQVD
jgi:hypothetical protein